MAAWASLPEEVLLRITALLPVDARLSVGATCNAWRDALRRTRAWRRLDLSPAGGVARARCTEALLRCASRRARGTLAELDLSACALPLVAVEAVLWGNPELRVLRLTGGATLSAGDVERLLPLADDEPPLLVLHAEVRVYLPFTPYYRDVQARVRSGALVLHGLTLQGAGEGNLDVEAWDAAAELLRTLAPQDSVRLELVGLRVEAAPAAAREACLDAVRVLSLREFAATACGSSAAVLLPAVAAAGAGQLRALSLCDEPLLLQEDAGYAALAAALRACADTLATLTLSRVCGNGVAALLHAVCAAPLPKLTALELCDNGTAQADGSLADNNSDADDADPADFGDDSDSGSGAPPPGLRQDEDGCGALLAALLTRSRRLERLFLPWLSAATLTSFLTALPVFHRLAALEVRVRDPSERWASGTLMPALQQFRPAPQFELYTSRNFSLSQDVYSSYSRLKSAAERARDGEGATRKPLWERWWYGVDSAEDVERGRIYEAFAGAIKADFATGHALRDKALAAARERWRCALRPPPPQRTWQHGARDFGALPEAAVAIIWAALDLSARVACVSVCRAWRAGFAPPDAWSTLELPCDGSPALRALAPHFNCLHQLRSSGRFDQLTKADLTSFLWLTVAPKTGLLGACLLVEPDDGLWSLDELASVSALARCRGLEADVIAEDGLRLLARMQEGLCVRTLELNAGSWDTGSLLGCLSLHAGACAADAGRTLRIRDIQVAWTPPRERGGDSPRPMAQRFEPLEAMLAQLARARLWELTACNCRFTRRFLPAVCALLGDGLYELTLESHPRLLKRSRSAPGGVAQLAAAIAGAKELHLLTLVDCGCATQADVAQLARACVGHASLGSLTLSLASGDGSGEGEGAAAVAAALVALVAANKPQLFNVQLRGTCTATQLAGVAEAVARNEHLDSIDCEHDPQLHAALQAALQASQAARRQQRCERRAA